MAYRRVEITVPTEYKDEAEAAMIEILTDFNPAHKKHLTMVSGEDDVVFTVNLHPNQTGEFLHRLEGKVGIGVKYGLATILDAQAAKPSIPQPISIEERLKRQGKHRKVSWLEKYGEDRTSIEEIHTAISGGNSLDFNFWCFLTGAAIIAAGGLATGSAVMVVASMLISPLMGPILAMVFGIQTQDWKMACKGFVNEAMAASVTFAFGMIFGFMCHPLAESLAWPTTEMAGRGNAANFLVGVIFAVASGVIVGVAVTGGGINSLVGVAISASLLPPIVNSGMLCAFAIAHSNNDLRASDSPVPKANQVATSAYDSEGYLLRSGSQMGICYAVQTELGGCELSSLGGKFDEDKFPEIKAYGVDKNELMTQAVWSLALYCMNVCVIGTVCLLTFKVKHLVPDPYDKMGQSWSDPKVHKKALEMKRQHVANHRKKVVNATTTLNPVAHAVAAK
eukprot:g4306.t1